MGEHLSGLDLAITAASLLGVFAIAYYSTVRQKRAANDGSGRADGFFLAGRAMPWWIIAASLFASNIGTEHFVGQAGAGAQHGMAVGLYDWMAAYLILALGWVFAPVYLRCKLTTIPEFLEARFNKWCRGLFVMITLVAYVISKIGGSLFAGSIVLEVVAGLNLWQAAPLILVATAIYTLAGGLTAVMLTDTLQMCIFLFGGLIGSYYALNLVGGISGLFSTLGNVRGGSLSQLEHALRPPNDRLFPWPGMLLGIPVVSVWYWCVDQEMAQRVLSAANLEQAQMGTALAALMKSIPVFITVVPGMVARALFEACNDPSAGKVHEEWCDKRVDVEYGANRAYPNLVMLQFPSGVKGIMLASFLAAMMSSLSSVFNSASTIFTYDVYQRFFLPEGETPAHKLVFVGRATTVGLTVLSFMWLPVLQHSSDGLYVVIQKAMNHLAPPVSATFVLGLFWSRANGEGALAGLASGTLIGGVRLVFSLAARAECSDHVDENEGQHLTSSDWLVCMNFNYFALVLFAFTTFVIVTVSFIFPPPRPNQIAGRMVQWGCCNKHSGDPSDVGRNVRYDRFTAAEAPPTIGENPIDGTIPNGHGKRSPRVDDEVAPFDGVIMMEESMSELSLSKRASGAQKVLVRIQAALSGRQQLIANVMAAGVVCTISSLIIAYR
ncbi:unnamed protein product [Ostreobium quekettii]|uniref:Sodium/solute symporter n=1 Tax=Ostreobium quekettii TaxID=121088 RepID=A0A8S1JE85_9CHLO|nr:unnamed protein product [Ostreobium quekettii]